MLSPITKKCWVLKCWMWIYLMRFRLFSWQLWCVPFFFFFQEPKSCDLTAMSSQTSFGSSLLCESLVSFRLSAYLCTWECYHLLIFLCCFLWFVFSPEYKWWPERVAGYSRRVVQGVQFHAEGGLHRKQQHELWISGTHTHLQYWLSLFSF